MIKSKHTNTISMLLREDSFQLYLWNSVLIFFKIFSINIWEIAWFWNIHLLIELLAPGFGEEVCLSLDSKRVIKSSREVHLWVKNSPSVLVMDNRRNRARRRHHHRITILCLWKILKNILIHCQHLYSDCLRSIWFCMNTHTSVSYLDVNKSPCIYLISFCHRPGHGPLLCGFHSPYHLLPLVVMMGKCCLVHTCIHMTLLLLNNEIPVSVERIPEKIYTEENTVCSSSKGMPTLGDVTLCRPAHEPWPRIIYSDGPRQE